MQRIACLLTLLFIAHLGNAQIGLGITTPHPNAYFQINSTNKGVLLPRMTAAQRIAIAPSATANGLIVFDTDSSAYFFWNGTAWKMVGAGSSNGYWSPSGNNIYNSNSGNVGIGISNPKAKLHVADSMVLFTSDIATVSYSNRFDYSGKGARMMWIPQRAAFRAGAIDDGSYLNGFPGSESTTAWDWSSVGLFSFATGLNTMAQGDFSIAAGKKSIAGGAYSFAMGDRAMANAQGSFAYGNGANAQQEGSVAFGRSSMASGVYSYAFGVDIMAAGANSFAFGNQAVTNGDYAFAFGNRASANGTGSFAFGNRALAGKINSFAFGENASSNENNSIAMGNNAAAYDRDCIVLGRDAIASTASASSIALGIRSSVQQTSSIAIGEDTRAFGQNSIAMGSNTFASKQFAVGVGTQNIVDGDYSIGLGYQNQVFTRNTVCIGANNSPSGANSVLIGTGLRAGVYGVALGNFNDASNNSLYPRLFEVGNGFSASSTSNALTLLQNGNLGLGTTTPDAALHIANNEPQKIILSDQGTSPRHGIGIANNSLIVHAANNFNLELSSGPQASSVFPQLFINAAANGNVGLQTRTPEAALHIANMSSFNRLILTGMGNEATGFADLGNNINFYSANKGIVMGRGSSSSPMNDLYIDGSTGFIGLGVANPTRPLSFPNTLGKKVSLFPGATGETGFAVFGNELRLYGDNSNADVTMGYDSYVSGFIERMRIKGNGNVGIGTNSPGFPLNFASTLGDKISLWGNTGNHYGFGVQSGVLQIHSDLTTSDVAIGAGTSSSFTENMRVKGNGNVGIGTTNPGYKLEVAGTGTVVMSIASRGAFGATGVDFWSDYGLPLPWRPAFIRTADNGNYTGRLEFYTNGTGSGNVTGSVKGFQIQNAVAFTATGTVSSFSDARIKRAVQPFIDGLSVIERIQPKQYYYTEKAPFQTDHLQVGVLAQELEQVAPYMVDTMASDGFSDLRTVNNQAYVFLLINAVKEQQQQIRQQQTTLTEQQQINAALQYQIDELKAAVTKKAE